MSPILNGKQQHLLRVLRETHAVALELRAELAKEITDRRPEHGAELDAFVVSVHDVIVRALIADLTRGIQYFEANESLNEGEHCALDH